MKNESEQIIRSLFGDTKVIKLIPFEEIVKLNKKKFRNIKLNRLRSELLMTLDHMKSAIDLYKELYKKTEYWELEREHNFNKKNWNTIRKVNGKITRYYNELLKVLEDSERELK